MGSPPVIFRASVERSEASVANVRMAVVVVVAAEEVSGVDTEVRAATNRSSRTTHVRSHGLDRFVCCSKCEYQECVSRMSQSLTRSHPLANHHEAGGSLDRVGVTVMKEQIREQ